ncbi:molybdopterin-dependent oxidoreductase [Cyanobacteria bacterium FACHB-472]|nr:molybdopterin-dependent oxidoreductase [Cyanobacteria bacterium FACHB-472]
MRVNPVGKNLALVPLVTSIVCLGACTNQPTDKQLEEWRTEALALNAQMVKANTKTSPEEWNLVIEGQVTKGKAMTLSWQQLQGLATNHVKTTDPNAVLNQGEIFDFRGIRVSTLLKKLAIAPDITNITFVCFDGYQATISVKDLLAYPITLAIARNGKPIPRAQGGPIYLVIPHTQFPNLKKKYNELSWAFYVTHMIIGTEPVKLRVGTRELDLAALDKLPQVTILENVGYRMGWPSGEVKLHGVRVRDILAFAGIQLPANGEIVVRGKAPIYHDPSNPVRLAANDLRECDILVATRWGNDKEPIPAKMGGPLTLAFSSECQVGTGFSRPLNRQRWVTFLEGFYP